MFKVFFILVLVFVCAYGSKLLFYSDFECAHEVFSTDTICTIVTGSFSDPSRTEEFGSFVQTCGTSCGVDWYSYSLDDCEKYGLGTYLGNTPNVCIPQIAITRFNSVSIYNVSSIFFKT